MNTRANNNKKITLLLLQETLWKIEDKVTIILENIIEHEKEINKLQRYARHHSERIHKLESPKSERREKNG